MHRKGHKSVGLSEIASISGTDGLEPIGQDPLWYLLLNWFPPYLIYHYQERKFVTEERAKEIGYTNRWLKMWDMPHRREGSVVL
jgi:hypothetical protein